jgi:transposase-like protein
VAQRVSPIDAFRAQIAELFGSGQELTAVLEQVGRLSVRLMMQTAIEAEVDAFLGRSRYQRRDSGDPSGYRNGHQPPVAVKTTMGPVELCRPKLRNTDERFCSRLFGTGVARTCALEALVISAWVRGLSDRDVEAALAEVLGPEGALSRSTVSRICAELKEQFARFCDRDLSGLRLDYLYLDGANFKMHEHARPEPVLVAWGIDTDGRPHLVAIEAAANESTDAWGEFLASLKGRGLGPPLLVISDGASGLIAGIEVHLPHSLRQRCLIHRLRNAAAKVSAGDVDAFKADWWGVFDHIEEPPGDAAVKECLHRLDGFKAN